MLFVDHERNFMSLTQRDAEFSYRALLLMPLRGTILLTLLGLAALYLLGSVAGLFGLWLRIVTVIAAVRYAQIIVEQLAYGHDEPPPLSVLDFNVFDHFGALGFYALLIVLLLIGYLLVTYTTEPVVLVYGALVAFATPALFAAAVLENSVSSVFNPVRTGRIIAAMGWRYVGVFAVVAAGYAAVTAIAMIIDWPFVSVVAALYGAFLLSCAVGRLVCESRTELGLDITTPHERIAQQDAALERLKDSNALQEAHQTARQAPAEAAARLWRYHDDTPTSTPRRLTCFDALKGWPNPVTALRFAQPLIAHLVSAQRNDDALDAMRWCLSTEPTFRLADAVTTHTLGLFADRVGQPKLAAAILQDIGKRFPDYPDATSGLFRAGAIAAQTLGHAPLLRSVIEQLSERRIAATDERLVELEQQLKELERSPAVSRDQS